MTAGSFGSRNERHVPCAENIFELAKRSFLDADARKSDVEKKFGVVSPFVIRRALTEPAAQPMTTECFL